MPAGIMSRPIPGALSGPAPVSKRGSRVTRKGFALGAVTVTGMPCKPV